MYIICTLNTLHSFSSVCHLLQQLASQSSVCCISLSLCSVCDVCWNVWCVFVSHAVQYFSCVRCVCCVLLLVGDSLLDLSKQWNHFTNAMSVDCTVHLPNSEGFLTSNWKKNKGTAYQHSYISKSHHLSSVGLHMIAFCVNNQQNSQHSLSEWVTPDTHSNIHDTAHSLSLTATVMKCWSLRHSLFHAQLKITSKSSIIWLVSSSSWTSHMELIKWQCADRKPWYSNTEQ